MYKFCPVVYLAGFRLPKCLTWWSLEIGVTRNYTKNGSFDTLKTEIVDSKHLIMNRLTHKQRSSKHNSPTYTGEMKDAFKELWKRRKGNCPQYSTWESPTRYPGLPGQHKTSRRQQRLPTQLGSAADLIPELPLAVQWSLSGFTDSMGAFTKPQT